MDMKELTSQDGGNETVSEALGKILSDPRIYNAVLVIAVEKLGRMETKELYNDGCSQLSDLPSHYLWRLIHDEIEPS